MLYKGRANYTYVHGYYPDMPGSGSTWEQRYPEMYGYDVAAAKRLLAEARYPKELFKAKAWLFPLAGAPEIIPLIEAVQIQLREIGIELELEEADVVAVVFPRTRDRKANRYLRATVPSRKAVETQIVFFNAGKATPGICLRVMTSTRCWEDLLQMADHWARDVQLRKWATEFEDFGPMPCLDVLIEVVEDPESCRTGASRLGWRGISAIPG